MLLIPLLCINGEPITGDSPPEVRALWVVRTTLTSPDSIKQMVVKAKEAGFNTLIVQVRGRGDAYYQSRWEPRAKELAQQDPKFDPLALVLAEAHKAGLKVHAWINAVLLANLDDLPSMPEHVYIKHPDWLAVHRSVAAQLYNLDPLDAQYRQRLVDASKRDMMELEGLYMSPAHPASAVVSLPCASEQLVPPPAPQNPSPKSDTTRVHPRVPKQEVAGQRFALSVGMLYLAPGFRARPRTPLIVHFHGSPWLMEYHIMRSLPEVALVAVNLGAGSGIYSQTFSDTKPFQRLLDEALARLREMTKQDVRWKTIILSSFSAGYGALRSILRSSENYRLVDAVFLADSLHTSYLPEGKPGNLDEGLLDVFARFADDAAHERKHLWVTHSEVFPGTFASTTETADYLLGRLALKRKPVLQWGPIGMQQLSVARVGNFYLMGFAGNSVPDHLDHFYALGEWLKGFKRALRL